MRREWRKYGWTLLAAVMLAACSKVPDEILSEKEMQRVLADMLIAEAMINMDNDTYRSDTARLALYEGVFRKHGITQALYDSSLMWYGRNLDIYMKVYDRVLDDINRSINDLGDVQADAAPVANQDSVNIWPRRSFLSLSPRSVFNGVVFDIKPRTMYSSGSSFVLGLRTWGLDDYPSLRPEIRISADQGDTTVTADRVITRDGYYETILTTLPTKRVRRVYGYIRLDNADSTYYKVYVDSLNLMKYNYGKEFGKQIRDSIP